MISSFQFTDVIARTPGNSVANGLRDGNGTDPDPELFRAQHSAYLGALREAGVRVNLLDALEAFPDSVFVEDAAICLGDTAIVMRPGAPQRFAEAGAIRSTLETVFRSVIELNGEGFVDGGDVLLAGGKVFAGLSQRTTQAGLDALADIVKGLGLSFRQVQTPASILHFKTACSVLEEDTIFSTKALSASGCFDGYRVINCAPGEDAAANLIRVNDSVLLSEGHPQTRSILSDAGYQVHELNTSEAAKVDAGLSCMSLRFALPQ